MAVYRFNEERSAWQVMDGEAVVINEDTSAYYSLNRTGTEILSLLARGPRSLASLAGHAAGAYTVSREDAAIAIAALLEALRSEGLISVAVLEESDHLAEDPAAPPAAPAAWEPPTLTRHGDLEKLVLSGE